MSDKQTPDVVADKSLELGDHNRAAIRLAQTDMIAVGVSAVWSLGVLAYYMFQPASEDGASLGFLMSLLIILVPIVLLWIGMSVVRTTRVMREESARLQAAIDGMRQAYMSHAETAGMGVKPAVERKLEEIVQAQRQTQNAIATFATSRETRPSLTGPGPGAQPALINPHVPQPDDQPGLALNTPDPSSAPPLSVEDFIGALNFPEDENDIDGFRQLRRALSDHESGKLVRSAQDVLTLLSHDGIYMDDLNPDRCKPEVWRKFAAGERGEAISAIGGVHDRSSLALASGRMRTDPVFRDTVHHFLRQFDKTLSKLVDTVSDEDIVKLAETRTSRAFMLLGRVTGAFDGGRGGGEN